MQHSISQYRDDDAWPLAKTPLAAKPGLTRRLGRHSRSWILAMALAAGSQATTLADGGGVGDETSIPNADLDR